MHEVLVNRLGGLSLPRKNVVRLTDRLDMTLDVYRGRKTTIQPTHLLLNSISQCQEKVHLLEKHCIGNTKHVYNQPNSFDPEVVRWCWVNFQCRGVLLVWIRVGQGPTVLAVGAGGGLFGHFYSHLFFLLFLPLFERRPDID